MGWYKKTLVYTYYLTSLPDLSPSMILKYRAMGGIYPFRLHVSIGKPPYLWGGYGIFIL